METQKVDSDSVMQSAFDKSFNGLTNQGGMVTNTMQGHSEQNSQSFVQSLTETRNIMSQFVLPQANTNTVNMGDFRNMLNMPNLKPPGSVPVSLPLNINYGMVNAWCSDPRNIQSAFLQSSENKPLEHVDQQVSSQDPKPVLPTFQSQIMQCGNTVEPDNMQLKQDAIHLLNHANNEAPSLEASGLVLQTSHLVAPLTDTSTNINTSSFTQCDICGKICKDSGKLKMHKYSHTKDKPFKCEVCFKSFSTNFKLKAHINIHGSEKPHLCPVCNKAFHNKTYVDRHMVVHSTEKPHSCPTCDKAFGRKEHLKRHLMTHSGEKPHACTMCDKTFRCKSNLITHVLKHSNPEYVNTNDNNISNSNNVKRRPRQQHHCTLCNAVFAAKAQFNAHVLGHTGRKPYQCNKCDKCFNDKSSLCRHNMVHTGEKPYQCTHCEKCFARRDHLQRHILTHTGEKPHQCKVCPKWFKLKRDLNAHIETHTENQPTEGGNTSDNQGSASVTPSSQASTEQALVSVSSGLVSMSSGAVSNLSASVDVSHPVAVQSAPLMQALAPACMPHAGHAVLNQPQIQVPMPPQFTLNTIPAHLLPQAPPGHIIMSTNPLNQLLSQLNMQQLPNGQIALNAMPPNQPPLRPLMGNGYAVNHQQNATLAPGQIPVNRALLNSLFPGQPNASGQFSLPAISSVMAPQNTASFQASNVKLESTAVNTFTPQMKSENTNSTAFPVKSENVSNVVFAPVKSEHTTSSSGYVPCLTSNNNNIINLGMSLPVVPMSSSQDVFQCHSDVISQAFAASQKATTDGDIYGQVENVNQMNQGFGTQLKEESVSQNGVYCQEEAMVHVDHSALISSALNTIGNCSELSV